MHTLRIDAGRLQGNLEELSRIGRLEGGGVCRLAFTEEDKRARDWVEAKMRALGLAVRIDRIGNILGLRKARREAPPVLCGSHTDTVATGGCFDGSVGVLAGLEVMETLNEAGIETEVPVGVLSFVNEEGARFQPDMMGSLVVRGSLDVDHARQIAGVDGITVGQEIDRLSFAGAADFKRMPIRGYLELHIEQGPLLEKNDIQIGIVEAVQGIRWIEYMLEGAAAHAGATPIELRQDAGFVAGCIVQLARRLSIEIEGQRATVGTLRLSPDLVNVVAEKARLTVDLRNPDPGRLDEAEARLNQGIEEIAASERVRVRRATKVNVAPAAFDPVLVNAVDQAARGLGYTSIRMTSGAGHDAQILAAACPAAMIFVPSRGGISHNTREYSSPEQIAAGANVLLRSLLAIAG
jgi:N-carbamoyl-L-amino-acid hydrolase